MSTTKRNYQVINSELEDVLSRLQDPELLIDEAIILYDRGQKLVSELEKYLKSASNSITKLPKKSI
jgi:exodeoxyribonuclease VII small subunit